MNFEFGSVSDGIASGSRYDDLIGASEEAPGCMLDEETDGALFVVRTGASGCGRERLALDGRELSRLLALLGRDPFLLPSLVALLGRASFGPVVA